MKELETELQKVSMTFARLKESQIARHDDLITKLDVVAVEMDRTGDQAIASIEKFAGDTVANINDMRATVIAEIKRAADALRDNRDYLAGKDRPALAKVSSVEPLEKFRKPQTK